MDSSTFWPCWVQLSGVGQHCHSVPEVSLWQHWDLPTGTVWRQENGPGTRKSFQWIKPCNCPLWHCASFTNAKCSKCRIIIFLQPKKGCNLPEVPWKVKDELGSESRSPDQTKLFTKLSCPQRLKSCFLKTIATPPKKQLIHVQHVLSARHTSHTLIHTIPKQLRELCTIIISILAAETNAQKCEDTCLRSHPAVK